jgi:hypothetical protein
MSGQHLIHRGKCLAAKLRRYSLSAPHVRIDHAGQAYTFALLFKFLVNSGVIAPKDAHAHHGDGDRTLRCQEKNSTAGCRKEIVNGIAGKSISINGLARFPENSHSRKDTIAP